MDGFTKVDAAQVNEAVQDWLGKRDASRPAFVFVHYVEPHNAFWYMTHTDQVLPVPPPERVEVIRGLNAGERIRRPGISIGLAWTATDGDI